MMTPENLIWLSIALPLRCALALIFLFGRVPNVREACRSLVVAVLFSVTCKLAGHVFAGETTDLVAARCSRICKSLFASSRWECCLRCRIGTVDSDDDLRDRLHAWPPRRKIKLGSMACFAIAIFAAMAAAYSANLFTLFVAYEVMTISTYPLVTHHGTEEARNGGRVYLGILLSTSVAFLMLAIAWTWNRRRHA